MPPPLSPATAQRLEILFAPESQAEATRLLEDECGNNLPMCEDHSSEQLERLRFAALRCSRGDLELLRQAIEEGKTDWRDLLMSAGFGHDVNAHAEWVPRADGQDTWVNAHEIDTVEKIKAFQDVCDWLGIESDPELKRLRQELEGRSGTTTSGDPRRAWWRFW